MAGSLFVNSLIFQITVCIVLINETSSYTECKYLLTIPTKELIPFLIVLVISYIQGGRDD